MYRRPKFIEALHNIRQEMAAEADHDVILFAEKARNGEFKKVSQPPATNVEEPTLDERPRVALRKR
ncbi:MAG: hypothetical protein JSS77_13765 [Acidobacteria bacterium]|nr:hypothetical protein [Acidobacteriota bacterium]HMM79579.1 hypothetical protein [Pyrinomonadaceae bacterium]